jgi:flagellar biosynthesis protein FlhB
VSDKTEEPTPRKLAKSREKGEASVSAAAAQAVAFLAAVLIVPATVAATAAEASSMLKAAIAGGSASSIGHEGTLRALVSLVGPPLLAVAACSALVTVVQTGALFAPVRAAPDLGRLDPIAGLRSLVSGSRLWNVARALLAAIAVAYLAWRALLGHASDLGHAVGHLPAAIAISKYAGVRLARDAALVGIAFALVDLVVTRRAFFSKLRMTKAEVKREARESEGDPQLKSARQRAHQEMLTSATLGAVKDATVVIVNPEHLATALRYLEGQDEAPTVVAAGEGELAKLIADAARAYGVPVVRDVPVARALRELEVGDTIPEALYEAVAEILREVWSAEEGNAEQGNKDVP